MTTMQMVPRTKVLVAEDNDAMRRLLVRVLEADGCEVLQAQDGGELLRWIEAAIAQDPARPLFEVVISDHRMPGMTGLEALRRMRALGQETPVILVTAFGDPGLHREALAAGALAVVDKPLDLVQLRQVVHAIQ